MYRSSDWQNSWSLYTLPPFNSFLAAPPLWLHDPHNPAGTLSPPLKYYLAADYWAEFDLWTSTFLPNEIQVEESSNLQPATIDPRLLHISAPTPICDKSEKFHYLQTSPAKDPYQ
ncbi:hypothetical protein CTheo_29 [Ceratobasidium theobromae]|uniref:Uncharacterized protein n=1 Tax=Ceratobasidium theobromae TaxID=1582974 RepID=A0A5N5QXC2_9AGAM|nr:hypothetical protein CTheo_29 [Ceratobasidium theobromae]